MEEHCNFFDIADGLRIVVPLDAHQRHDLTSQQFDLWSDFPLIEKEQVILSTLWYQMWADVPYVKESMNLQMKFFHNNVSPEMWSKCHEELLAASPACQTGPLMLYLILRRVHNCSESTLDLLLTGVRTMKISEYEAEDVDVVVKTVNTAVSLLQSSSSKDRKFITHDFARDLLRLFQTSTSSSFNVVFSDIERACQTKADSLGQSVVQWPSLESITQLALNTYHRLSSTGAWVKGSAPAGFTALTSEWKPGSCFNCGGSHGLPDCPEPINQATVDANKKALADYRKLHPKKTGPGRGNSSGRGSGRGRGHGRSGSGRGSSGKPHCKLASDGKPLKLNAAGNYVLDQKKWHAMQTEQAIAKVTALLSSAGTAPPATPAALRN